MASPMQIDEAKLQRMWTAGKPAKDIAYALKCSDKTVIRRAGDMGLPERYPGWKPADMPPPAPPQHKAAVLMPSSPLEARKDWPALKAAVERAQGHSGPVVALGMIAARFRLPVAVVQGLAGRLWK